MQDLGLEARGLFANGHLSKGRHKRFNGLKSGLLLLVDRIEGVVVEVEGTAFEGRVGARLSKCKQLGRYSRYHLSGSGEGRSQ